MIENYDKAIADNTQTWQCHHRLETHNSDGERRLVDISSSELIALGMYFDRPPEELIFLTSAEHVSLHKKGKYASEETRKRLSEAHKRQMSEAHKRQLSEAFKGRKNTWFIGKHHSEEAKKKISEAMKGKAPWNKGKHWKLVDGKRVYC